MLGARRERVPWEEKVKGIVIISQEYRSLQNQLAYSRFSCGKASLYIVEGSFAHMIDVSDFHSEFLLTLSGIPSIPSLTTYELHIILYPIKVPYETNQVVGTCMAKPSVLVQMGHVL